MYNRNTKPLNNISLKQNNMKAKGCNIMITPGITPICCQMTVSTKMSVITRNSQKKKLIFDSKITEHVALMKKGSAENRGAVFPSVNTNATRGRVYYSSPADEINQTDLSKCQVQWFSRQLLRRKLKHRELVCLPDSLSAVKINSG